MKNKMVDVRNHLCAALESLADPDKPMELDRAKAISEVAQTYINSVKVEVDAIKVAGDLRVKAPEVIAPPEPLKLTNGGQG
jgi:hypothetical protein